MSRLGIKKIIGIVAAIIVVVCLIVVGVKFGKKPAQNNEGQNTVQNTVQNTENNSATQEENGEDVIESEEPQDPAEQMRSIAKSVDEHVQLMRESAVLASGGLATDDVKMLVEQIRDNFGVYKSQLETVEDNGTVEMKAMLSEYIDDAVKVSEQFVDALEKNSDKAIKKVQDKISDLEDRFKEIEKAGK